MICLMCEHNYNPICPCHSKHDKQQADKKPKKKTMKEIFHMKSSKEKSK